MLMEGESLFNDATAIVVFSVFLAIATGSDGPMSLTDASQHFLRVFFGGILVGAGTGLIFAVLVKLIGETIIKALATVISAYLAYLVAESLLHVSHRYRFRAGTLEIQCIRCQCAGVSPHGCHHHARHV
jgi:CPA1 family monovalent cation:H+ antiporter